VRRLHDEDAGTIVAMDVRDVAPAARLACVHYERRDVRAPGLAALLHSHAVDTVVHLASIVTPTPDMDREFMYAVDVLGTQNVLDACVEAGVHKIIVTSSGAAYGYYKDNPELLVETGALRGNEAFAYSHHKRLVEEMLARYRTSHPELTQLVFRLCTVLGATVSNQITALFEKPVVLGFSGASTPFVFVWDQDVVECIARGVGDDRGGIYNVAADGTMTMKAIARRLGKPYIPLPAGLVRAALAVLKKAGLSRYGPEQVEFLRYRPVLSNAALKATFGYTPRRTSAEAFELYLEGRSHRG
jgi:UDP-glucose 4-epimerase